MAFPSDQTSQTARWSQIQQIIDVLTGVSGGGDRVQLTQYNNTSNYVLDVKPIDTTNGYALRVRDASDNVLATFAKNAIVLGASAANDTLTIAANLQGKVYIGDSANGDMTIGLTINQAANDNQVIGFKSSDVGHAMTGIAEADTFGYFRKAEATSGGLQVVGLKDTHGAAGLALQFVAYLGEAADTTKTTDGVGVIDLHVSVTDGGTSVTTVGADGNLLSLRNNGTTRLLVDAEGHIHSIGATATDMLGNGKWFLNDTASTDLTLGLCINQAGNDDAAVVLKSSDVAHGMTALVETDTYGSFGKSQPASGGLSIQGFKDADDAAGYALGLVGRLGEAADTTKSTAGIGVVDIQASVKDGTGIAVVGANGNLLSIGSYTTTRFILDADGDSHQDVGTAWTNFDAFDDIALLTDLSVAVSKEHDPIREQFTDFLRYNRQALEKAKLVTFNDDGHHFVNMSKMTMLLTGAIRQLASRLELAEAKLQALPAGN